MRALSGGGGAGGVFVGELLADAGGMFVLGRELRVTLSVGLLGTVPMPGGALFVVNCHISQSFQAAWAVARALMRSGRNPAHDSSPATTTGACANPKLIT